MNVETIAQVPDLTAADIVRRWADSAWRGTVGVWAVGQCRGLRAHILAEAARAANAGQPTTATRTRGASVEDVVEKYLSKDEFATLLSVHANARRAWLVPPPESPEPPEAYYWLIRAHLLTLLLRYTQALAFAVAFQKGLRVPRPDEPTLEIGNLLCEPADGDHAAFLWIGIFTTLYNTAPCDSGHTCELQHLMMCFGSVAEIFYNLTGAVYSSDLVLDCRRAFSAFWRKLGTGNFIPSWETFVERRHALDEAIRTQKAGRFSSVEKSLDLMAVELASLKNAIAGGLAANPQGTAKKTPARRGPKGPHEEVSGKLAAEIYNVSASTISNWDNGCGNVPPNYIRRNATLNEFMRAATEDLRLIGGREGTVSRLLAKINSRRAKIATARTSRDCGARLQSRPTE